jgi:hypothetical protein
MFGYRQTSAPFFCCCQAAPFAALTLPADGTAAIGGEPGRDFDMRLVAVILAMLLLLIGRTRVEADGYTERQTGVIGLICDACARYSVDCTLPLAIARRESGFGASIESKTDHAANGTVLSIGVFQWHAYGLGGYRGPGYEDDWRWDVRRDVERGVDLITSHLRGGPSYLRHWYTPAGLDITNLPACASVRTDESAAGRRAPSEPAGQEQGTMPPMGDGRPRPQRGGDQ